MDTKNTNDDVMKQYIEAQEESGSILDTNDTSIVKFWARIFKILGRFSLFEAARRICKPKQMYIFVEGWVLGNLFVAISGITILFFTGNSLLPILTPLSIYGSVRVFEIVIYQINVLLFDKYRAEKAENPYHIRGPLRSTITSLQNYVETVCWYALLYLTFSESFSAGQGKSFTPLQAIGFSFNTLTSFGYTTVKPLDRLGYGLVFSEAAIGVFMVVVILARFISLLPSPESVDKFE